MNENNRKRDQNFKEEEKNVLLDIISTSKYKNIIENKQTNKESTASKNLGREKISKEFNAQSTHYRSINQLQNLYRNLRRTAKKDLATNKISTHLTVGGAPPKEIPSISNKVLVIIEKTVYPDKNNDNENENLDLELSQLGQEENIDYSFNEEFNLCEQPEAPRTNNSSLMNKTRITGDPDLIISTPAIPKTSKQTNRTKRPALRTVYENVSSTLNAKLLKMEQRTAYEKELVELRRRKEEMELQYWKEMLASAKQREQREASLHQANLELSNLKVENETLRKKLLLKQSYP